MKKALKGMRVLLSVIKDIVPIAIAVVALFLLHDVFSLYKNISDAINLQREIKELSCVVKNLSRTTEIAYITCKEQKEMGPIVQKQYIINVLSPSGKTLSSEDVTLVGSEIYVDSCVLNFDYSQIGTGEKTNVAWPYRVYSERMAARDGVPLRSVAGEDGVPTAFRLSPGEIYGLSPESYDSRIAELAGIINDDSRRQAAGIRAFIGSAVHVSLEKGESCFLRIEGTGGISLMRETF